MRWASSLSLAPSLSDAVSETAATVQGALRGHEPDLVAVFVSPQYGPDVASLADMLAPLFPFATVVGCTAGGVVGDGREVEGQVALSLTAGILPDVAITPFHLGTEPGAWDSEAPSGDVGGILVLPEPFTCDAQRLVRWLDERYPDVPKVGGLASGGRQLGAHALFVAGQAHAEGAVGVALHGDIEVGTAVAQGCRPIGAPMFVSRCAGNAIYEVDGEPVVQVVQRVYNQLSKRDEQLFRESLFLGLAMREAEERYEHGDFLIRNVMGIDPARESLLVAAQVREGQVVQFHLRDARTSSEDLDAVLARSDRESGGEAPHGALMFSCLGRGAGLYGHPDHDSDSFRDQYGATALGGFFCNGEIGPVQGQTFLHGYTSSFALFRPRRRIA